MGFDVAVAVNDRTKVYAGERLADLPGVRSTLPHQFDRSTGAVISLIDVLWLNNAAIVAAFEIESTTSIYSGLLRMSDLLALQPNLNIPLYLVAPLSRRSRVFQEVNRPTFSSLSPPLSRVCRYISFEGLAERLDAVREVAKFLRPDFLVDISESCVPDTGSVQHR